MYSIDAIQGDYGPRKRITGRLPDLPALIKMYEQDSAFLCGSLAKFRPQKIVEVGVANGGTSAVIMQCLHDLGLSSSIYSIDILEKGFDGSEREIGFLGKEAGRLLDFKGYHLFKGVCLPQVIEQIGGGIDFLILDTVHRLPGEVLDFLAAYPYLAENAVVCMHDIILNQKTPPDQGSIATNALMNSVAADKYINLDPTRVSGYPNIGAFQINQDTGKYISNVFGVLTQNWSYFPPQDTLEEYGKIIHARYPAEPCWIYDRAVEMNAVSVEAGMKKRSFAGRIMQKLTTGKH